MNYKQKLPKNVEQSLDAYIERIKKIEWFKVGKFDRAAADKQIKTAVKAFDVEASIEYRALNTAEDWGAARGAAWDAARDAAWDAAWDAARGAARDAARGTARDAAWGAAWDAAWGAARDAAWDAAWDAARGTARGTAWDAAWDAARGTAWDAAWGAARDAARDAARGTAWDAAWGAARGACDLFASQTPNGKYAKEYPQGNFLQLIPLWEQGLYPCGVIDGKFVCYVPGLAADEMATRKMLNNHK